MSLETFLDLSPSEFSAAYESWLEIEIMKDRNDWDRARWVVFKMKTELPPGKKEISVLDIAKFPWEEGGTDKKDAPPSTRERFEEMKKKMPPKTRK